MRSQSHSLMNLSKWLSTTPLFNRYISFTFRHHFHFLADNCIVFSLENEEEKKVLSKQSKRYDKS